MEVLYESVDKNQRAGERTGTEDGSQRAFRTRVLTKNDLHMHRAHAKQGTVSEQELSQVWPGGVTERRDGKYCRRKRGPYSEMLSGKSKNGHDMDQNPSKLRYDPSKTLRISFPIDSPYRFSLKLGK